ncbi:MAG: 2-oxoacid:acceptor oxidoreductase subunit alpha [Candidatus Wallbacteria bacterium]
MIKNSLNILIGGEAGDGILSTGEILCKIFFEMGYGLCTYKNFPSRIRGGHTAYSVRIADDFCAGRDPEIDILVVFDSESFEIHKNELKDGSVVFYDSSKIKVLGEKPDRKNIMYYAVPFAELASANFQKPMFKNTIAIGCIASMLNIDNKFIENGFAKSIKSKKGDDAFDMNLRACGIGANYYNDSLKGVKNELWPSPVLKNALMMTGNEAITLGALTAGCKIAVAYPISPATEIFESMCSLLPKYGGNVMQAEDEIAALCAAMGGGFAGARSMTSTSGPGISLMAEAIGLAGCAEVPVVIIDAQRPGPSTGLPTKTEQGDYYHSIFCSHGDIPRIVIIPGNLKQCFEFTVNAFNLADIYQCPVIVLSEQALSQNKFVAPEFDFSAVTIDRGKMIGDNELEGLNGGYLRYKFTDDGVSPRTIPGQKNGIYLCNGNEHCESGRISEDPLNRVKMMDKRQKKIESASKSKFLPQPEYFGNESAEYGVIMAGSNYETVKEAFSILDREGANVFKAMQITALMPFPAEEVSEFCSNLKKVIVIENNKTAQLSNIIKMNAPVHSKLRSILKYDGVALSAKEIALALKEVR